MDQFELRSQFTEEFFEEFQFDSEFRNIFFGMYNGLITPYEAIEHLCKSKKELFEALETAMKNTPRKIIVTSERLEQLKQEIKPDKQQRHVKEMKSQWRQVEWVLKYERQHPYKKLSPKEMYYAKFRG